MIYEELHPLAAQKTSQKQPGQTLQATALVHKVYLRSVGSEDQRCDNRGYFFKAVESAVDVIWIDALNPRPAVWSSVAKLLRKKFHDLLERCRQLLFDAKIREN